MKKVFVAMSGGVDSSVAAALLKQQGYQVTGVFMKNWTRPIDVGGRVHCPWREDLVSARQAAHEVGIALKVYNFELAYHDTVVEYFFREYAAGRTPNPDVMCNREIKFGRFLQRALAEGADCIATGHYARVARNNQQSTVIYQLLRGIDQNKDQSYFLWAIKPEVLHYCLFPIGDYRKSEVRQLARQFGLPNAERKDSQGICFIGPVSVSEFLREELVEQVGQVRTAAGELLGMHSGVQFVTIGQRHGIGVATGQPVYVADKDVTSNTVYVDEDWPGSPLYSRAAFVSDVNWFEDEVSEGEYDVQVRYRQKPVRATLTKLEARITKSETNHKSKIQNYKRFEFRNSDLGFLVRFSEPVRAVTEGQSLVCYDGKVMLGGGVIDGRQ